MLKSKRLAYDGRGNAVAKTADDLNDAVSKLGGFEQVYIAKSGSRLKRSWRDGGSRFQTETRAYPSLRLCTRITFATRRRRRHRCPIRWLRRCKRLRSERSRPSPCGHLWRRTLPVEGWFDSSQRVRAETAQQRSLHHRGLRLLAIREPLARYPRLAARRHIT